RKNGSLSKDIDVSFIGTLHGGAGRWDNIKHLSDNGINIETFGWDSPNRRITFEKKIEIINRSKINLDFSGVTEKTRLTRKHQIYKRMKQIKGKVFEHTMCGSFALCEYAPGLEHFFEIGEEIDIFHDKEELLEKVKYYLEHEEERENIARRGYERAVKDYSVERAVPKLISIIDELRKTKTYKPSEIYLDEEFIRNYTTYRALLIIRFIKQLKWKFALEELKIILKYRKLDWYQILIFFKEEFLDPFPRFTSLLKQYFFKKY
ncbi:MAG: glycosyltransferase, partial [Nitrospirota bacterium]|nr:glycosyltransferase [Nitrospirota bacterium]